MARLIDYGLLGETTRFEAWRATESWTGDTQAAARALDQARLFFEACGLTAPSGERTKSFGR